MRSSSLSQRRQTLWRRLAVFPASFSLQAVEAVCAGEGLETAQMPDLLARLVKQGLVVAEGPGDDARYRLPQEQRLLACEALSASGEADNGQQQHATYYLALAEDVAPKLNGPERGKWLDRLDQERGNLLAALQRFTKRQEIEPGWRLATALWDWWRWHLEAGRAWFAEFLALPEMAAPTIHRAQALDLAGALAFYAALQSDAASHEAQSAATECRSLAEESLAVRRGLGDKEGLAQSLLHRGVQVRVLEGDFRTAGGLFEESRALYQELGDPRGIAYVLGHQTALAVHEGNHAAARRLMEESLARHRELGLGDDWTVGLLDSGARYAAAHAQPERALRLAGAARAQRDAFRFPLLLQEALERVIEPARQALDAAAQAAAWAEGQRMTLDQAVAYALQEPAPDARH